MAVLLIEIIIHEFMSILITKKYIEYPIQQNCSTLKCLRRELKGELPKLSKRRLKNGKKVMVIFIKIRGSQIERTQRRTQKESQIERTQRESQRESQRENQRENQRESQRENQSN